MPIYEYQCAACGGVVERWQKISDAPLSDCPVCGGGLHKIISSCAFHLKGGGWYVTDYAGKNPASGASDASADTAKPGDSGDAPKAADTSTSTCTATADAAPASKIK